MISLNLKKYNRWQASASHLAISLVIFLVILSIIVFIWYPGDLIHAGGWQGIKIVAGVDLILGPLLTLIIYNTNKESLKYDLSFIIVIQFCALAYGLYSIYNARPYVTVLSYDGLHVLTYKDTKHYGITESKLNKISKERPIVTYMDLPNDDEQMKRASFTSEFVDLKPIVFRNDLYRKFPADKKNLPYTRILEHDTSLNCHKTKFISAHTNKDICLNLTNGKFSVR